jgi:3-hydroxyisobutyrate dehydrogenase
MIAFLGMGLLGSNFTKALLKQGNTMHVWNRTSSRAFALEADGAKAFESAADAVKGAKAVHIAVKDDAAVDEVLGKASAGFEPDVIIIDHTTTSAEGAAARTEYWKSKGFTYLHAPVFMGPQNALESTGYMLVSGDQEVIARVEPFLAKMTGKVLNFGTVTNKAAGIKLLGNLFLIAMTAGLGDTMALAKALDIETADILKLFESWNPGNIIPARVQKIASNTFDQPTWELVMARKDAGLMIAAAVKGGKQLNVIPTIANEMDQWIAKGHGQDDWTVITKKALE